MKRSCLCLTLFYFLSIQYAKPQLIEQAPLSSNKLAVPFLLLSSDAISSGMGEAGAALLSSSSTAEASTAKSAFLEGKLGVNLSYTPWLKELVSDRKLMFVGGFCRLDSKMTLTTSLNYLSYGQIDLIDANKTNLGNIQPTEYVASVGIAKGFGSRFSLGMKLKIIHSNLYTGSDAAVSRQAGSAYCIDISSYHIFSVGYSNSAQVALAINIENIGPKISYYNRADQKSFLPGNLRIGSAYKTMVDPISELGIALDFSKLLVPLDDVNANESLMQGMVSSFNSNGAFNFGVSLGAEYCYKKTAAFRLGYNLQGDERSPGSFFSVGIGFKRKTIALNMAYLTGNPQRTFLSNTMRFTLGYAI
ncbi:type IX secretion system outer membrane channel protein PorV [Pedobacter sp. R-06]|uniref:type IX secretion system outer membrane channel protein PorV n=1 Tax=Pedobacter sp. R-06 TaxID=3404051 RepID=UPI003CF3C81D